MYKRQLYDRAAPKGAIVLTAPELADMNYMLSEVVERGTGRRARVDGHMIAGKTGTTNDFEMHGLSAMPLTA